MKRRVLFPIRRRTNTQGSHLRRAINIALLHANVRTEHYYCHGIHSTPKYYAQHTTEKLSWQHQNIHLRHTHTATTFCMRRRHLFERNTSNYRLNVMKRHGTNKKKSAEGSVRTHDLHEKQHIRTKRSARPTRPLPTAPPLLPCLHFAVSRVFNVHVGGWGTI